MDGGVHGWVGGHPNFFDPVPEIAFVITQPRQNLNPDPSLSGHHSSFVGTGGNRSGFVKFTYNIPTPEHGSWQINASQAPSSYPGSLPRSIYCHPQ